MILAVNNVIFPNSDSKITINTYKIRLGQKLRMLSVPHTFGLNRTFGEFCNFSGT